MKLIGITGGVGCGKSLATAYLQQMGFHVLDADFIVRELFTKPEIQNRIQSTFQTLDKNSLREIIFRSPEKRKQLEIILHPKVIEKIQYEIMNQRKASTKIFFVSIPLLFEKKLESMFDEVIAVSCNQQNQMDRLKKRDNMDSSLTQAMIESQWSTEEKASKAHHVLHNDGSIEEFHRKIDELLKKINA